MKQSAEANVVRRNETTQRSEQERREDATKRTERRGQTETNKTMHL